jgi:hypothetical protein
MAAIMTEGERVRQTQIDAPRHERQERPPGVGSADMGPRFLAPLAPLLWSAVAVLVSRVPGADRCLPALGLLRGPLGLALIGLGLTATLARAMGVRREPPAWVFFTAALLLYLAVGLYYTSRLRVSGDEPHYLLMAQSLWREHDLDLRDNLERGDYLEYTPGPVVPHYATTRPGGRPYPAHSPGLPLLLAPLYAVGGRAACVLLLALMGAALTVEVRALALLATAGAVSAGRIAWAAALGPPILYYAFHVYSEVPAALGLAFTLRVLLAASPPGPVLGVLAALAASALPWLHVRMIPVALVLGVIAVWRLRGRPRLGFLGVAALMAGGYLAYYDWVFGTPSPLALYGGVPADAHGSPARAVLGLLLDRSFGLLPHAPVFLLALPGLLAWRRRGASGVAHALVAAAVGGPVLTWRMWWGGQCPPARLLVPLVPCLGVALALRVAADGGEARGLARWRWVLVAAGLGLALYACARPGELLLLNRGDRPTRLWSALSGEVSIGGYLPSLVAGSPRDLRLAAAWVLALTVVFVLDALARRHESVDYVFRSPGLALALVMLFGSVVMLLGGAIPTG